MSTVGAYVPAGPRSARPVGLGAPGGAGEAPTSFGRKKNCGYGRSARKVAGEEGEDLLPGVHRLLGPVDRPVVVDEAVAGPVVPVELVVLAVPLQLRLVLVHLRGRGVGVVVAEDPEQRRRQVGGVVDRRDRAGR